MEFSDLPIYTDIKTRLKTNIDSGRVPHAQFFLGADGSGNLPMAIAYANELLAGEPDMFGGTDSRAARLLHPDLHIVFPVVQSRAKVCESFVAQFREAYQDDPFITFERWSEMMDESGKSAIISVHESVEMSNKLNLRAYEGGHKVLIIWMPEMINIACANKMLKLIEEPPQGTVILLVGADYEAMLPTIRSRVQLVKFKPLPDAEMHSLLLSRGGEVDAERMTLIMRRAEGNLSTAMRLLKGDMTEEDELHAEIQDWMRQCYKIQVVDFIKWVDGVAKTGRDAQKQLLVTAMEIFRMAFRKNYITIPDNSTDSLEVFTQRFSPFVNEGNAMRLIELFDTAHRDIERNGNSKIIFTDLSFQVAKALRNPVTQN